MWQGRNKKKSMAGWDATQTKNIRAIRFKKNEKKQKSAVKIVADGVYTAKSLKQNHFRG
jgi:hypothetical protein